MFLILVKPFFFKGLLIFSEVINVPSYLEMPVGNVNGTLTVRKSSYMYGSEWFTPKENHIIQCTLRLQTQNLWH